MNGYNWGKFFSEYFSFLCHFSFHRMLRTPLSSGAGSTDLLVAGVPNGFSLTSSHENPWNTRKHDKMCSGALQVLGASAYPKYTGSKPPAKRFESMVAIWAMIKVRRATLKQSDQNLRKWIKRIGTQWASPSLCFTFCELRPYWLRWAKFGNLWQSSGSKHNSTIPVFYLVLWFLIPNGNL